ncbi:hypothetical protein MHL_2672 [Mesomycoplasma hyopneumoniae 7422]|nr:hypothetical protein MHL_2672 [Mesomycoplasma hyopneumoniae 7422]
MNIFSFDKQFFITFVKYTIIFNLINFYKSLTFKNKKMINNLKILLYNYNIKSINRDTVKNEKLRTNKYFKSGKCCCITTLWKSKFDT